MWAHLQQGLLAGPDTQQRTPLPPGRHVSFCHALNRLGETVVLACGHAYSKPLEHQILEDGREDRCLVCGPHTIPVSALHLQHTNKTLAHVAATLVKSSGSSSSSGNHNYNNDEEDENQEATNIADEAGHVVLHEDGGELAALGALLTCPLSGRLLEEPVTLACGCNFSRPALVRWAMDAAAAGKGGDRRTISTAPAAAEARAAVAAAAAGGPCPGCDRREMLSRDSRAWHVNQSLASIVNSLLRPFHSSSSSFFFSSSSSSCLSSSSSSPAPAAAAATNEDSLCLSARVEHTWTQATAAAAAAAASSGRRGKASAAAVSTHSFVPPTLIQAGRSSSVSLSTSSSSSSSSSTTTTSSRSSLPYTTTATKSSSSSSSSSTTTTTPSLLFPSFDFLAGYEGARDAEGRPHGEGRWRAIHDAGVMYKGQWTHGRFEGQGILWFGETFVVPRVQEEEDEEQQEGEEGVEEEEEEEEECLYKGGWKAGQFHGHGRLVMPPFTFEGEFAQGVKVKGKEHYRHYHHQQEQQQQQHHHHYHHHYHYQPQQQEQQYHHQQQEAPAIRCFDGHWDRKGRKLSGVQHYMNGAVFKGRFVLDRPFTGVLALSTGEVFWGSLGPQLSAQSLNSRDLDQEERAIQTAIPSMCQRLRSSYSSSTSDYDKLFSSGYGMLLHFPSPGDAYDGWVHAGRPGGSKVVKLQSVSSEEEAWRVVPARAVGTMRFGKDGSLFTGEWLAGKRDGVGMGRFREPIGEEEEMVEEKGGQEESSAQSLKVPQPRWFVYTGGWKDDKMERNGLLYRGPGVPVVDGVWRAGVLVKSGSELRASADGKKEEKEEKKEKEEEEEKEEGEEEETRDDGGAALIFVRVREPKSCGKEAVRSEEEGGKEEVFVSCV